MNLQETLQLIAALKAKGVTKFKSHEHEIEMVLDPDHFNKSNYNKYPPLPAEPTPESSLYQAPPEPPPEQPISPEQRRKEEEAARKIKEMIETIALKPEDLANKIFPDGAI